VAIDPLARFAPIEGESQLARTAEEAIPQVLAGLGIAEGEVVPSGRPPQLTFQLERDGQQYGVNYNLLDGRATANPLGAGEDSGTRRFLLRLHTSHGFPISQNARWFWAVLVDAMAVSMVFWGFSGVLMWWQLKKTRLLGAGAFAASILAASLVASSMHDLFASSPRRGRGPFSPAVRGGIGDATDEAGEQGPTAAGPRGRGPRGGFGGAPAMGEGFRGRGRGFSRGGSRGAGADAREAVESDSVGPETERTAERRSRAEP